MSAKVVFINNQFHPEEKASIHISDLAIQRAYGIFDFFRVVDNTPIYLDDHLNRFYYSAEKMRLQVLFTRNALTEIIYKLIHINNVPVCGIKIILTGGYSSDGYSISQPNLIISQLPLQSATEEEIENGLKLITYEYQRDLPEAKTINYTMAIWLQPLIKEKGSNDVLYQKNGIISECPRSNLFIVTKEQQIFTPSSNILRGITRNKVLKIAKENFVVDERDVTIEDVKTAREVFITNTTKRILPVVQVDETLINNGKPGKITLDLRRQLTTID